MTTHADTTLRKLPAGWYNDPLNPNQHRFFDGANWTPKTRTPPATLDQVGTAVPGAEPAVVGTTAAPPLPAAASEAPRKANAMWSRVTGLKWRGAAGAALLLTSVGGLSYAGYETVYSNRKTEAIQQQLHTQLAAMTDATVTSTTGTITVTPPPESTGPTAPTVPPAPFPDPETVPEGAIAGQLIIPKIGVDVVVLNGTEVATLKKGPGVWTPGVTPGAPGNATISGHRTTYGSPFRRLDQLEPGDQIIWRTPGRPDAVFEVRGFATVRPEQVSVTYQTEGVRLTLTTCEPVGSAARRLVLQAELVDGEHADVSLPNTDWVFQI